MKIVQALKGERWPIESKYLEPVVHSLMHIDGYEVSQDNCEKLVVMASEPIEGLAGTYLAEYIARGEEESVHKGSTVAARAHARPWYDLTNARRVGLFWAKSHQYRHCAPINPSNFVANCNLYTVETEDTECAAAVLNSTLVVLAKQLFGRPVGVEGNLKTEVVDVNMMPVPDWTAANSSVRSRLSKAFAKLRKRKVIGLLSEQRLRKQTLLSKGDIEKLESLSTETEFDQEDRAELDDAVLELIGISNATKRREIKERLYQYLEELFENTRHKEELAIVNKAKAKRQAKLTPQALASDVFALIESEHPKLLKTYRDLLKEAEPGPTDGVRVASRGRPEIVDDMLMTGVRFATGRGKGELVRTRSKEQAELVALIFESGGGGRSYFVPVSDAGSSSLASKLRELLNARERTVKSIIAERTGDLEITAKSTELVMARF